MDWLYLSLASGFLVAAKNIITRKLVFQTDKAVILYAKYFFVCIFCLILILFTGVPEIKPAFYGYAFIGSIIDVTAAWCFLNAIASSQLAKTFPLVAVSPVFLLGTSFVILGEAPSLLGLIGILLIVCGAYLLRAESAAVGVLEPVRLLLKEKGSRHMLMAALLFSFLAPFFKKAILNSSPFFALGVTQCLSTLFLTIYHLKTKELGRLFRKMGENYRLLMGAGISTFLACVTFFDAFQLGLAAYVVSVKRTSILFTIILGYIFLKEDHLVRSLSIGCIMVLGILLISL
jgi:uncharacterized membrane protein